jgi:O-antigen/teichoic acid export membrane protein
MADRARPTIGRMTALVQRFAAVRVRLDLSFSVTASLLDVGAQFVLGLLLARVLGPVGIGLYFVGTTTGTFLLLLTSPGVSSLLPREISKGRLSAEHAVGTYTAFRTLISMPLSVLLTVIAALVAPAEYRLAVVVGCVIVAGLQTHNFLQSVLEGVLRFDLKLVVLGGYRMCVIAGALLSLLLRAPVDMALLVQAAATWISVLFAATVLATKVCPIRPRVEWHVWRGFVVLGAPILLTGLLFQLSGRLDTLLLAGMSDAASVGQYSTANLVLSVFSAPAFAVVVGAFPTIAERSLHDPQRVLPLLGRAGLLIGAITVAGAGVCWVVAPPVIPLFFGSDFQASVPLVRILALALLPAGLARLGVYALVAMDRTRLAWLVTAASLVVATAADFVAIPRLGAAGAAWVTVGGESLMLLLAAVALILSVRGRREAQPAAEPTAGSLEAGVPDQ